MESVKKRFEKKVKKLASGCWEWTQGCSGGYGQFFIGGRVVKAHRASYELYNGPIPDGLFILHRCDNSKCVNPEHLEAGTQSKNMKDMYARQRRKSGKQSRQREQAGEGEGLPELCI